MRRTEGLEGAGGARLVGKWTAGADWVGGVELPVDGIKGCVAVRVAGVATNAIMGSTC